jgi:hypothetical protein
MAGVITTGSFAKAMRPGLKGLFQLSYSRYNQWMDLYPNKTTSDKNYEEYLGYQGLGYAAIKPQGSPVVYSSMQQGYVPRLTNVAIGLGFMITREARDDNQYMQLGKAMSKALGVSFGQTKEVLGANVYNRAFDSNYVYWDGVELCSTAHVTKSGATFANELATPADLSEAAIEQATIDIANLIDENGLRINVKPRKLIVANGNQFEATRILKSEYKTRTANNDVNAVVSMGVLPDGYALNNYLTDTGAHGSWFILTDVDQGMTYQERQAVEFTDDNDFDTENAKFKGYERYVFAPIDVRGIFGSPGA